MDIKQNHASTSLTDEFKQNNAVAKKVAALLAESAVTVSNVDKIFKLVKEHLTVALGHSVL